MTLGIACQIEGKGVAMGRDGRELDSVSMSLHVASLCNSCMCMVGLVGDHSIKNTPKFSSLYQVSKNSR